MLADGLIDGLHLFVYPLTRGRRPAAVPAGRAPGTFSLGATAVYENGVVYLNYRAAA